MGCGNCSPKKKKQTALYECTACGRLEVKEDKKDEEVKSCCGQPMKKK